MRTTRSTCDAVLDSLAPVRPLRGTFLLVTRCPCLCAVMLQLGTHLLLLVSRLGARVSHPLMSSLQEWSLLLALFAGPVIIEALGLEAMRREVCHGACCLSRCGDAGASFASRMRFAGRVLLTCWGPCSVSRPSSRGSGCRSVSCCALKGL